MDLPLVGHDLQEGSDFIGGLKTGFDTQVRSLFVTRPRPPGGHRHGATASLQTALAAMDGRHRH
jgi:hypothetical protein